MEYKPLRTTDEEFKKFQAFVEQKIGIKFPEIKRNLLESRLSSHISKLGFSTFHDYYEFLQKPDNTKELDFFIDKITTHTTSFFREQHHFDFLTVKGLEMLSGIFPGQMLKFLSLGSSTGEEMYTLAMILQDFRIQRKITDYQIDAADISKAALLKAKEGIFKMDHYSSIPQKYKNLFSINEEKKIAAKEKLKYNMRFFLLNAANPSQKFPDNYHVVFCRNTLIYFSKDLQQHIINNINKVLLNKGLFFVGHSESLYGLYHSFQKVEPTIYQKLESHK